jgi:hypothetical protein
MQLPGPVRAFVGLLAVTADEAKHLPDRAIELPMLAVSSALQMSLRAQQRYARLAARGDDVISRRPPGDEPPAWATFDDPVAADDVRAMGLGDPDPAQRARAASQLLDELLGDGDGRRPGSTPDEAPGRSAPSAAKKQPGKKATTRAPGAAAKKQATKRQPAKRTADKAITSPRHTAPSRFDTVEDD